LVSEAQLNGGEFAAFTTHDWMLIRPYLEENQHLFGVAIDDLLRAAGAGLSQDPAAQSARPASRGGVGAEGIVAGRADAAVDSLP
jgi:hypothetical protein